MNLEGPNLPKQEQPSEAQNDRIGSSLERRDAIEAKTDEVLGLLRSVVDSLPDTNQMIETLQTHVKNGDLNRQIQFANRLAFSAQVKQLYEYATKRNSSDKMSGNYPSFAPSADQLEELLRNIPDGGHIYSEEFTKLINSVRELKSLPKE